MKNRLILGVSLIILALFTCMFVGCKENNEIISYGFAFKSTQEESSDIFVAYSIPSQINKNEEIVVDLCYGHISKNTSQIIEPDFDLIIYNLNNKDNRIEQKITDFYSNDEYLCSLSRENKYSRKWEINYSHKETLVLPSELFFEDKDEVVLRVQGTYGVNEKRSGWISFCYCKNNSGNIEIKKGTNCNVNYI
ncbi:MAG: hypothetical protein E7338_05235 [Clostridiales bacterium]|nr:hypothetical protein [Clostridiales bacterium]